MATKPFVPNQSGTLVVATRTLLKRDKRSLFHLHQQTGLPFFWLAQFKANRSVSPSVDRVQYLYEFLSGKKLPV